MAPKVRGGSPAETASPLPLVAASVGSLSESKQELRLRNIVARSAKSRTGVQSVLALKSLDLRGTVALGDESSELFQAVIHMIDAAQSEAHR